MTHRLHAGLLALAIPTSLLILPAAAQAQSCWITSAPNIAFGTVDNTGTGTSATLGFSCSQANGNRTYRLCLFVNPVTPTGVAPRQMVAQTAPTPSYMNFDLYADAAHTRVIGAETSGHPVFGGTLSIQGNRQISGTMTLYGAVPAGQNLPAANYGNQMIARLRFAHSDSGTPSEADCQTSGLASQQGTTATATWANTCRVTVATDLDFGSTGNLTSHRDQTSTIQLQCPTGTAWRVGLDNGIHAVGSARRMASGGNHLSYELYRDSARTQRWGNTSDSDAGGTGNGATQSLTVHGRVPAQPSTAGTYADTVTVTLTY